MNKNQLLLFFFFTASTKMYAQNIATVWCSENNLSCIQFDSITHRMNIGGWSDNYLEGRDRIIYSQKDSIIKIKLYYNCSFFYCRRNVYYLKIHKLTKTELSLSFLESKHTNPLIESFNGTKIDFIKCPYSCEGYYEKRKLK